MKIGLTATAGLILLAGCSSVPDAVNPVEWYKGATSLFEDDAGPAKDQTAKDQAASDSSYPNLSSVPARPTDISTPSERRAAQQGLVADREQARYTDQQPSNAVTSGSSQVSTSQVSTSMTSTARTEAAPPAPPAAAPAPTAPAAAEPAPAAAAPSAPPAAAPSAAPSATPAAPPAARIAPRAESSEPLSAGAAMMERRRQEVLAERAAATGTATGTDSTPQQSSGQPSEQPRATASQPEARPEAPAARTETAPAPAAPSAAEVYREQFARSAAPVATRSAETKPAETEPAAPAPADRSGISYLAATILFGHGSTTLDPSEGDSLRKVAAEHRKTGGTLRIVGHASSRTTDMRPLQHQLANFQVSVSRAEAVAQELRRLGVPAKSMEVVGVGDSQPIYYEVMPAGEAGNRRVEIFVDY